MTKHGGSETGGRTARAGRLGHCLGQVLLDTGQFSGHPGLQGGFDSLRELLERQAAREKMLTERGDSLFPVSV